MIRVISVNALETRMIITKCFIRGWSERTGMVGLSWSKRTDGVSWNDVMPVGSCRHGCRAWTACLSAPEQMQRRWLQGDWGVDRGPWARLTSACLHGARNKCPSVRWGWTRGIRARRANTPKRVTISRGPRYQLAATHTHQPFPSRNPLLFSLALNHRQKIQPTIWKLSDYRGKNFNFVGFERDNGNRINWNLLEKRNERKFWWMRVLVQILSFRLITY